MEGGTDGVYKEESLEVVRNFVFEAARACDFSLSLSICTSYNNPVIFLIASSAGPSPILHAMSGERLAPRRPCFFMAPCKWWHQRIVMGWLDSSFLSHTLAFKFGLSIQLNEF